MNVLTDRVLERASPVPFAVREAPSCRLPIEVEEMLSANRT